MKERETPFESTAHDILEQDGAKTHKVCHVIIFLRRSRMKQRIQKLLNNETFTATLLILFTTLITYGVSIPKLGYYHDDWYLLWSGEARGAASIIPLFASDRPFMGVVYSVVYRLLGDTIIHWHLYALLWRFIGGLAFFWILRLLWPEHRYITTLMVILFMVYPGFLSQPNANTKQNHLYGFGTALLSIAFMLGAMKTKMRGWKLTYGLLSVVLTANYLFIYEYMIGFEGVRLILLGYYLFQNGVKDIHALIKGLVKRIWPYWIVTAGFLYWRIFLFAGSRNATDATKLAGSYLSDLRYMSIRMIAETAKDFIDTSLFAWFAMPYRLISGARYSNLAIAVFVVILVIALVSLYTSLYKKRWGTNYSETDLPRLIRDFFWIGAFIILCAITPVIFSGRDVELFDAYKSYGLHPIPGVILFVATMVLMLQPNFRKWALVVLIGISVSAQVLNADNWGDYWEYQRQMWWQLTWRAPDIQDDTLVMSYSSGGYNPEQDYELWGPLNLIYNPGPAESPVIEAEVLNADTAYSILKGEVKQNHVRGIKLYRNFNNLLLIDISPTSSCLHVIDGSLPAYSESEALLSQQVGGYSHIDRIVPSGSSPVPPYSIFGSEPAHNWCYYYEKASLARQIGNWEEVGKLYDMVGKLHLETNDKSELIPFFEGLVNLGRLDDARALYKEQIKRSVQMRLLLCTSLAKNPGYPPAFQYDYESIHGILCSS